MQLGTITIQAPTQPFLLLGEVAKLVGVSEKTIGRWVAAGTFPPPVKVGGRDQWTNLAVGVWMAWQQVCPLSSAQKTVEVDAEAD